MANKVLSSRGLLPAVAVVTVLSLTGFYGLRAATGVHFYRANPQANVRTTTGPEAAAERGYSAIVKQVLPAVVNISSSRVVKPTANEPERFGGSGMDPFLRQFFGDDFSQRFSVPRERVEKALG